MQPDYLFALTNVGNIYFLLGEAEEALTYFLKALEIRPEDPAVFVKIAKAHYKLEDYSSAARYYRLAISKDPKFRESYAYLGGASRSSTETLATSIEERNAQVDWDYDLSEE